MEHDVDLSVGGQVFLETWALTTNLQQFNKDTLSYISLPGLVRLSMDTIVTTVAIWFTDRAPTLGRV